MQLIILHQLVWVGLSAKVNDFIKTQLGIL